MASRGLAKLTGLPSSRSSPAIGLLDAEQDFHQRGFAGAVLADHGVDFARLDGEIDAIIGDGAAGIGLADGNGFEQRRHARASAGEWPRPKGEAEG